MTKKAPEQQPVVFVIDDDPSVRAALARLFKSVGLESEVFGSAPELLQSRLPDVPSCLILDVRLPGMDGLALQRELERRGCNVPIVFVTAYEDPEAREEAIGRGAVDFLPKPFQETDLMNAVQRASARYHRVRGGGSRPGDCA